MTRQQLLGQARAVLTAIGAILIAFGFDKVLAPEGGDSSGAYALIAGLILAGTSLGYGIHKHEGPAMIWSLVRKLLNAGGALLIYYSVLTPEKWAAVVGVIGPVLALRYSWAANKDDDPQLPLPGLGRLLILLAIPTFIFMSLPSCTLRVDPSTGEPQLVADPGSVLILADKATTILNDK
jgi:hypothetical protein